jgi:hypothetical protein
VGALRRVLSQLRVGDEIDWHTMRVQVVEVGPTITVVRVVRSGLLPVGDEYRLLTDAVERMARVGSAGATGPPAAPEQP